LYKLLLVTDRDEVRQAFLKIDNWEEMMFRPVTMIEDVEEAIDYLESHAVDAVGYSIANAPVAPLHQYLNNRPSLPVFQTHKHDDTLRRELMDISRFLGRMHSDDTDEYYDEQTVLNMLRDELMRQLIREEISSREQLLSRIKLVRANASATMACYLYDFDLPQGEVYLADRWHYGSERLESALRNNFFGRYIDDVYYDVAVLTPRHIRVFACPRFNTEKNNDEIQQAVQARVRTVLESIKQYLDLDLDLEQMTVLPNLFALVRETEET